MVRYPLLRGEASAYRPNFGAICTGSSSKLLTSTVLRISVHLFAFIFCYIHLHWHPCAFSLLTSGMSEFYIHPGLPVDHSAFHLLFSSLLIVDLGKIASLLSFPAYRWITRFLFFGKIVSLLSFPAYRWITRFLFFSSLLVLLFSSECRPRQDSELVVLSCVQVDHPLLALLFSSR